MRIEQFMVKVGVKRKKTVENWVNKGLIPGIKYDNTKNELIFPDSARRPYKPRVKANSDASVIRASILNACLKREYVSSKIYYMMSDGEFKSYIGDLLNAGLIKERVEDGIIYYDSTLKCERYKSKKIRDIQKFINYSLKEIAKATAYGITKALFTDIAAS